LYFRIFKNIHLKHFSFSFISQEKSLPSINNKLTINNMNLENFFQLNFSLRHGKIPVYQRMDIV